MPETARFANGGSVPVLAGPGTGLPDGRTRLVTEYLQACLDWKKLPVRAQGCADGVHLVPAEDHPMPPTLGPFLEEVLGRLVLSDDMKVLRLKQAAQHKPQDRAVTEAFPVFDRLVVMTPLGYATAWVNPPAGAETAGPDEILLTNRIIRDLYHREWQEGGEAAPGLAGAPVLVRQDTSGYYQLGLPKADQIDRVYLSSLLHDSLEAEAEDFDFYLYNPLTDTRMFFPFEGCDYGDHGRVRFQGEPARKVMMPRYYRILMGYQHLPVSRIRKEAFAQLLQGASQPDRELLAESYLPVDREIFYDLQPDLPPEQAGKLARIEQNADFLSRIQILRRPKETARQGWLPALWQRILTEMVGANCFELKVTWTIDTDDRNNVARLNPDMMSLMGVSDNDKIIIRFGRRQVSLRVLAAQSMELYQVGVPAAARQQLGLNSVNDIVSVQRNMNHILAKYSQVQAMTILGTLLAVSELLPGIGMSLAVSVLIAPFLIYFVLREEREKVR